MFPQHQVDIDIPSRILAEARIRDFFKAEFKFPLPGFELIGCVSPLFGV